MDEEVTLAGSITFKCLAVAIAQSNKLMDQVSIFPHLPACSQGEPTPQIMIFTSSKRGRIFALEVMGVNVQCSSVRNLESMHTWDIREVEIVIKDKYKDQVILRTMLPSHDKTHEYANAVILMDNGVAQKYVSEILKLPFKLTDLDAPKTPVAQPAVLAESTPAVIEIETPAFEL